MMISVSIIILVTIGMLSSSLHVSGTSWVKILNKQTALESDLQASYQIDNFDPARFHDIHSLLYAGSSLLYATRVPGGEGVLSIPCGVITHAGTHTLTISYTNSTVIATTQFGVAWPVMAVTVPHRMETFTMDVVVRVSFTKNLCAPLPTTGNNNNQRVLQGGENGVVTVWLKVDKCETNACDDSKVMYMARVENFYSSHSSKVTIKCSEWGVAGIFRVIIVAEINSSRHVDKHESVIARSRVFSVDWSSEYQLSTNRKAVEPCQEGDSLVVEMNYPACILDKDKIRLYQERTSHGSGRRTYIGEQRVIPGDKAVIFPCSAFNTSSSGDRSCFSYVSAAVDGAVAVLRTQCLPYRDTGGERRGWDGWSSWSSCSTSCGEGVETRYRFCGDSYPGTELCKGSRATSRKCLLAKCTGTTSIPPSSSLPSSPSPRPTPVYVASPCACGCTYILHSSREDDKNIPSRDINIVSGICPGLPISWTVKVPSNHQMILTLSNVSFSCPSLHMSIRDGVLPTDRILYQVRSTTHTSTGVQSSRDTLRIELQEDHLDTNLTSCYAVLHLVVTHQVSSQDHSQQGSSFLKSEMKKVLKLSTPILLVISLTILMIICTLTMLVDYQIKKVKYSNWKAHPNSGYSTPTEGCQSYVLVEDIQTSLSTLSDYAPLVVKNVNKETIKAEVQQSKSVPATPARNSGRRLLRRSETMGGNKIRVKNKRKISLAPKVSKSKLYLSLDTIDGDDEREDNLKESYDKLADIKPLKMKKVIPRRRRKRNFSTSSSTVAESSSSSLHKTGSEDTLKQAKSVSEFSCNSLDQELEYDLYDCHIDNAIAMPGSLFAPAYWDADLTPTEELELEQLFKDAAVEASDRLVHEDNIYIESSKATNSDDKQERPSQRTSPVVLRSGKTGRKPLITSITSDLTASISSAISDTTLVGDMMDTSCYYSGEEETSLMFNKERKEIMNLTHIEEIQFVDE